MNKSSVTVRPSGITSLSSFYKCIFADTLRNFPDTRLAEDYVLSRLKREGEVFATHTLPLLGKAFESSIAQHCKLTVPSAFKKKRGTDLPQFLYSLFRELYEENGELSFTWNEPEFKELQIEAFELIRTITMSFSKVETVLRNEVQQQALEKFSKRISTESFCHDVVYNDILKEARRLLTVVFSSPEADSLRSFQKEPWGRQGPGAVAGKESGASKWAFNLWPGLEPALFKFNDNVSLYAKRVAKQPCARATAVPKDFRGPRLICIEPKENQFAQQGLLDCLTKLVHSHPLTRRSINFNSVERQQGFCFDKQNFATIDLENASDHLSLRLVKMIVPKWVYELTTRYRSRLIAIDDKFVSERNIISSKAFATMGNAICFPMQTLVFWALSLATLICIRDSWPRRLHSKLNLTVGVFGDDIVVPLWGADEVQSTLAACGLVVNKGKTCVFSALRESCGEYVFGQTPIHIVRFKSTHISKWRDYLAWIDYAAEARRESIKCYILESLADFYIPPRRWNHLLQRLELRLPTLAIRSKRSVLPEYSGLYAWNVGNNVAPLSSGHRKKVRMEWVDEITAFAR